MVHSKNTFCTCQREHPQWDSPSTPAALPHANSPRGQEDGQSRGCKGQPLPHTETTHCEQVLLYCAQKRGGAKHCCNNPSLKYNGIALVPLSPKGSSAQLAKSGSGLYLPQTLVCPLKSSNVLKQNSQWLDTLNMAFIVFAALQS